MAIYGLRLSLPLPNEGFVIPLPSENEVNATTGETVFNGELRPDSPDLSRPPISSLVQKFKWPDPARFTPSLLSPSGTEGHWARPPDLGIGLAHFNPKRTMISSQPGPFFIWLICDTKAASTHLENWVISS